MGPNPWRRCGASRIFISSEKEIPPNLEKYKLLVPVEKMHSVLYFSSLYIGEGATMASEAAVLGTPSIYLSKLSVGYLKDLSKNSLEGQPHTNSVTFLPLQFGHVFIIMFSCTNHTSELTLKIYLDSEPPFHIAYIS